jgi:O-acetyl-ADP-ribose deacetylase (regulator of RNase III)
MPTFHLTIRNGSIIEFFYAQNPQLSAIVNAANQSCIGGGGLDGAIRIAGGPSLMNDRLALPIVAENTKIRCPKGDAKVTGPNQYGTLRVPFVIHAVGADYRQVADLQTGDAILRSAYLQSLKIAESLKLDAIAFPLLSSGAFRNGRKLEDVMKIGIQSIRSFPGYPELREVFLYAFGDAEFRMLQAIASKMALSVDAVTYSIVPGAKKGTSAIPSAPPASLLHEQTNQKKDLQPADIAQLKAIQEKFHGLIRQRNKGNENMGYFNFPNLVELAEEDMKEIYYGVPGMYGGFDTKLSCSSLQDWKVVCSSWSRVTGGSGQTHEITKDRIKLLAEGFV